MKKFSSKEIKLGIVSDIKVLNINRTMLLYNKNLRGIIFTENNNIGTDLLYSNLSYPIKNINSKLTSNFWIENNNDLRPLLEYYGFYSLTYKDLYRFIENILLNEKWLRENTFLFGDSIEQLPLNLGKTIYSINDFKEKLTITKKERKRLR